MRLVRTTIIVAITLGLAMPLAESAAASSSSAQSTTGTIAGTIESLQSQPLAGVCVTAQPTDRTSAVGRAQSAADGSFAMAGLAAGTYTVVLGVCWGSTQAAPNVQSQYYDNTQVRQQATLVSVSGGATTVLHPQLMKPGGEIDLHVNAPQAVSPVAVYPQLELVPGENLGPDGVGVTQLPDAYGAWRTTNLQPGTYLIYYQYCDATCRPGFIGSYQGVGVGGTPTPITVTAGGVQALYDTVEIPPFLLSTTTATASPSSTTLGSQVALTVHVADSDASVTPTGVVQVGEGSTTLSTLALDAQGSATFFDTALTVGTHTLTVGYLGDGQSMPSSSTATVTVNATGGGGGGGGSSGGGGGGGGGAGGAASGTVSAGGTFSSDGPDAALSVTNPVIVGVQTPNAGTVSIDKTAPNTPVAHYRVLGIGATIAAPTASVASPLTLVFKVFDGALAPGLDASDLAVMRDGVPITSACTGTGATPDPCLASVTTVGAVTTISVRSSHASAWDVEAAAVGRIAGANRIATAVAASQNSFPSGHAGAVVLARADDYPDALVGAPLAAAKNAPLLLTQGTALPTDTAQEIARVLPAGGTIYLLGGTAAIPASVASDLTASGYQVVRYAGVDRYATAVAVAGALGDPTTVLLATGTNFPDALSAGPAAAHLHGAVLLTNGASLPSATSTYLNARTTTAYAVGGPAAAADPQATAIVGADRYATAAAVASHFFPVPTRVGVATGVTFPDALAGGAQLALVGGPLLLSAAAGMPVVTTGYLTSVRVGVTGAHVYGGTSALSEAVLNQLRSAVGG